MEKALTRWEVCNSKPSLFQWEKKGERSSEFITCDKFGVFIYGRWLLY